MQFLVKVSGAMASTKHSLDYNIYSISWITPSSPRVASPIIFIGNFSLNFQAPKLYLISHQNVKVYCTFRIKKTTYNIIIYYNS